MGRSKCAVDGCDEYSYGREWCGVHFKEYCTARREAEGCKECAKCEEVKPLSDFVRDKSRGDGYSPYCKLCKPKKHKRTREQAQNSWRRTKYGVSPEQYAAMLIAQEGLCAVCRQPERRRGSTGDLMPLSIDHCHTSMRVRGLLCRDCNNGIGLLGEDPDVLRRAAQYVGKV